MIFLLALSVMFLHMLLIWVWYLYRGNPSVVDVGWASGLTLIGFLYLYSQPLSYRSNSLSLLLLLWGGRLGLYLWLTRIRRGKIDQRYISLSEKWKMNKPLGFLLNFQLQGLLILIISLPWYFVSISDAQHLKWLDYFAIFLALISIILESIADRQLQKFKKQHSGKLCNTGLWGLSRHPNYFFEWLTWCSFAIFAFATTNGWLASISPLLLYVIMTRVTGPMTEAQSIKSKGNAYLEYQQNTPMFFPKLFRKYKRSRY